MIIQYDTCETCIHFTGRVAIDGRIRWSRYCTYPVYEKDTEPVLIDKLDTCPGGYDICKEPE
jgi:hypothetical protein